MISCLSKTASEQNLVRKISSSQVRVAKEDIIVGSKKILVVYSTKYAVFFFSTPKSFDKKVISSKQRVHPNFDERSFDKILFYSCTSNNQNKNSKAFFNLPDGILLMWLLHQHLSTFERIYEISLTTIEHGWWVNQNP